MQEAPPFVDIHCHLLPGVDDGASDFNESLAMAQLAVDDGISTIIATPHQLGNHSGNHGPAICEQTAQLQQLLAKQGIPLRVLPGGDVRIEPDLVDKLRAGEVLTLADRRRHVLLELPHELYPPLERLLDSLHGAGITGILSHPERNLGILTGRDVLWPLAQAGCLFQVTAGSLVGTFGPDVQQMAQWLVRQGLAHFVATDAHGIKVRRPLLRRAFDCVAKLAGYEVAVDLCCRNPAAVLAGKPVSSPRPTRREPLLGGWFRWKKAG